MVAYSDDIELRVACSVSTIVPAADRTAVPVASSPGEFDRSCQADDSADSCDCRPVALGSSKAP